MKAAAPRSVNRLRPVRVPSRMWKVSHGPKPELEPTKPPAAQVQAPASQPSQRPAVERFQAAVEVAKVKRPIGRPPKVHPAVPGQPPAPQKPPYSAPSAKVLGRALAGTFNTLAIVLGPHWKFKPEEGVQLAEDWIPVLEHYKIDLGKGGIWAVAIGGTLDKLGPRILQSVIMRKTGLRPPSEPEPAPQSGVTGNV